MAGSGEDDVIRFELRGRARIAALVAAAGVFAVLLVQGILLVLVSMLAAAGTDGLYDAVPGYAGSLWAGLLRQSLVGMLPFAAGVFLVLWLVAPIGPRLRLSQAVLRGLLAVGGGTVVVIAIAVLLSFLGGLTGLNFLGFAFPDLGGAFRAVWLSVLQEVVGALSGGVARAPLVVLAAVLLWLWHRRRGASGSPTREL